MAQHEANLPEHTIELSTLYFWKGPTPKVIRLSSCGIPLTSPLPRALTAFYGYQGKQAGFAAASEYAYEHRLNFTVVDLLVDLHCKVGSTVLRPDEVSTQDFMNLQRVSRTMVDKLAEDLFSKPLPFPVTEGDLKKPLRLLKQHPSLISRIYSNEAFAHMKVISFPANTALAEESLNLGVVPYWNWAAIQDASCRLNPEIRVTYAAPALRDRLDFPDVTDPQRVRKTPVSRMRG